MALRLVVLHRGAAYDEFPWFGLHGTDSSALRARLGLPEFPHLLAQGLLDGSLDDGLSCLEGNRFDGVEVEVQVRSLVAKGAARHDFPPVFGQGKNLALTWDLGASERHYEFLHELGKSGNLGNFT